MNAVVQELLVDLFVRWSWPTAEVLADYFEEVGTEPGLDNMLRSGPTRNLRWRLIDLFWIAGAYDDDARERAYEASAWWMGWTYDAHVHAREERQRRLAWMLATNAQYGRLL